VEGKDIVMSTLLSKIYSKELNVERTLDETVEKLGGRLLSSTEKGVYFTFGDKKFFLSPNNVSNEETKETLFTSSFDELEKFVR
jgi:hypothetical protein